MPTTRQPPVLIRPPGPQDCRVFLGAVRRSQRLHKPWVTPPDSAKAFAAYLERLASGYHYGFLVVRRQEQELAGVINLNNVIRGAFQSAFLGYYAFLPWADKGLMHQGMLLVIRHAFSQLRLHRLEANVQPANRNSIALLKSCGFRREGFSRRYLKVAGRWRDHERWAILRDWNTRK
jgi:ribosomal-protein-alanine N-acetyltransferase